MTRRARLRRKIRKSAWRQARQLRARHYRALRRQLTAALAEPGEIPWEQVKAEAELRAALHEGQP